MVGWVALAIITSVGVVGIIATPSPAPIISAEQLADRVRVVAIAKAGMFWTPVVDCGVAPLDVFEGRVVHCNVWDASDPETVYDVEAIFGAPDRSANFSIGMYIGDVPKNRR